MTSNYSTMCTLCGCLLLVVLSMAPTSAGQPPDCSAPALSDDQVKAIVDKQREIRQDLPARPAEYKWLVRRQGCHYVYIENPVPETPDEHNMFWLNPKGLIVDIRPGTLTCPEKVLTEHDLAEIVKTERSRRKNLPPPFAEFKTSVTRMRCLYLYTEHAAAGTTDRYQAFTIDPYGELFDVFRSK